MPEVVPEQPPHRRRLAKAVRRSLGQLVVHGEALRAVGETMRDAEVAYTIRADGFEYYSVDDLMASTADQPIRDLWMGGRAVGGTDIAVELHPDGSTVTWSDAHDLRLNGAGIAIVDELRSHRRRPTEILGLFVLAAGAFLALAAYMFGWVSAGPIVLFEVAILIPGMMLFSNRFDRGGGRVYAVPRAARTSFLDRKRDDLVVNVVVAIVTAALTLLVAAVSGLLKAPGP